MPGPLAHWLVAREMALRLMLEAPDSAECLRAPPLVAVENRIPRIYRNGSGKLEEHWARSSAKSLEEHPAFFGFDGGLSEHLYFGAILPDLGDYAAYISPPAAIASELAHVHRPASLATAMVLRAREYLEKWKGIPRKRRRKTSFQRKLAFRYLAVALGHISHICSDALLHRYTNSITGDWNDPSIRSDDGQLGDLGRLLFEQSGKGQQATRSPMDRKIKLATRSPFVQGIMTGRFGGLHRIVEAHQDSWVAKHYFSRFQVDDSSESWTEFLERTISTVTTEKMLAFGVRRAAEVIDRTRQGSGGLPVSVATAALPLPAKVVVNLVRAATIAARFMIEMRNFDLDFREWFHEHRLGRDSVELERTLEDLVYRSYEATYGDGFRWKLGKAALPFGVADLEDGIAVYYSIVLANAYDRGLVVPDNPYMPFVAYPAYRSGKEKDLILSKPGRTAAQSRTREADLGGEFLDRLLQAADLAAVIGREAIRLFHGELEPEEFRKTFRDWNLNTGMRIDVGAVGGPFESLRAGDLRIKFISVEQDFTNTVQTRQQIPGPGWVGSESWRGLGRILAERGAPILYQTIDDPYRPIPVERALRHRSVLLLDGEGRLLRPHEPDGIYRLNRDLDPFFHTSDHRLDFTEILAHPAEVDRIQRPGSAVYFRQKRLLVQGDRDEFLGERIVIQYWLFYLSSQASLPDVNWLDDLIEDATHHQGDWEFFQIIWERSAKSLDDRDGWGWGESDADEWTPAWIGTSIHYYGEGMRYERLREEGRFEDGRPVVFVAEGGHGCHVHEGIIPCFTGMEEKARSRTGEWAKTQACDYTSADVRLCPEGAEVWGNGREEVYSLIEMEDHEPWLDWPGHFGRPGDCPDLIDKALGLMKIALPWQVWLLRKAVGLLLPEGPRGPKYRHPMRESIPIRRPAYDLSMWSHPMEWQAEFSQPAYIGGATHEGAVFDALWVDSGSLRPLAGTAPRGEEVGLRVRAVNIPEGSSIHLAIYSGDSGKGRRVGAPLQARAWNGSRGIYLATTRLPPDGARGRRFHFRGKVVGRPELVCVSDVIRIPGR
ncbi:MAG: zinc dependent phospholipase C family protein [Planctomycetota bacterium]|nr:zinc dependent phospholipase C family protein [Planctomycetota bacterium]